MDTLSIEERALAIATKNGRTKPIKADMDLAKMEHLHASKTSQIEPKVSTPIKNALLQEGIQIDTKVVFKSYEDLHENPNNFIFDDSKTPEYLAETKRDIRENGIRTPINIMPDGEIIAGHTRRMLQHELYEETNDERFALYPCLIIRTDLNREERNRQAGLDNFSRFNLSKSVRIKLSADLWPSFYKTDSKNPPDDKSEVTVEVIAEKQGTTIRQVFRDRETYRAGEEIASQEGRSEVLPVDIKKAMDEKNIERKVKEKKVNVSAKAEGNQFRAAEKADNPGTLNTGFANVGTGELGIVPKIRHDIGTYEAVKTNELLQAEFAGFIKGISYLIEQKIITNTEQAEIQELIKKAEAGV